MGGFYGLLGAFLMAACATAETPPPQDRPYPGTLSLSVDARDIARKIFTIQERIPVAEGALTLLYPEWLPGDHAPAGEQLAQLGGLSFSAGGHPLAWRRDPLNVYAFHLDIPPGTLEIEADFQFLSPTAEDQGDIVVTPEMLAVHWEKLVLYPAGHVSHDIIVRPSLALPRGWQWAGALAATEQSDDRVGFAPINLEDLIDSPIYAGKNVLRVDLDPGAKVRVTLDMFADSAGDLSASPAQIEAHRALVRQAYKLFGGLHYDHYDFLMTLSDDFGFAGLEHHQSGENGVRATYFEEWDQGEEWRSELVSHEFTHSWDGKFRRPIGQLTGNFNQPMSNDLLWVYEGATTYWGYVLAARSGLVPPDHMRDGLARAAAFLDHTGGRRWRALQDTTNDPVINRRRPLGWRSWERAEDYYREGALIWLDADTLIREKSGGKKSLDDFARAFFGVESGRHTPLPYDFADVVAAMNAVLPYDWAAFFRERLDGHGPGAPLDGLTRGGWSLVYDAVPTDFSRNADAYRHVSDYSFSLGVIIDREGVLRQVLWDSPAFGAGLTVGSTLLAVNGRAFTTARLDAAITAAKSDPAPMELLLKKDDRYETVRLDYHDGLRYPHLARLPATPDRLTEILTEVK
jgi:predicted metalloprotease with PDZ domain